MATPPGFFAGGELGWSFDGYYQYRINRKNLVRCEMLSSCKKKVSAKKSAKKPPQLAGVLWVPQKSGYLGKRKPLKRKAKRLYLIFKP